MSEDIPFDEAATLLGLMANDSRLRIFELITQREWDVGSLAVTLHISQSALSQHLKKMRDLKVVAIRRDRQTVFYSSNHEGVLRLLGTLKGMFDPPAA